MRIMLTGVWIVLFWNNGFAQQQIDPAKDALLKESLEVQSELKKVAGELFERAGDVAQGFIDLNAVPLKAAASIELGGLGTRGERIEDLLDAHEFAYSMTQAVHANDAGDSQMAMDKTFDAVAGVAATITSEITKVGPAWLIDAVQSSAKGMTDLLNNLAQFADASERAESLVRRNGEINRKLYPDKFSGSPQIPAGLSEFRERLAELNASLVANANEIAQQTATIILLVDPDQFVNFSKVPGINPDYVEEVRRCKEVGLTQFNSVDEIIKAVGTNCSKYSPFLNANSGFMTSTTPGENDGFVVTTTLVDNNKSQSVAARHPTVVDSSTPEIHRSLLQSLMRSTSDPTFWQSLGTALTAASQAVQAYGPRNAPPSSSSSKTFGPSRAQQPYSDGCNLSLMHIFGKDLEARLAKCRGNAR
jgi:hypothetical protein